jgi:hypothetical protein
MLVIDLLCTQLQHTENHFYLGTAGAGSLILEFATLSRLTGDERFEKAAYKVFFQLLFLTMSHLIPRTQAFFALWNRKSDIGLVGNTINTWNGVSKNYVYYFYSFLISLAGVDSA